MSALFLALWGGFVGVDATSLLQVMVSRPFVAGTVAGWIAGAPVAGAVIGAVLEVFALNSLPIGAARYPEHGTGAVAAVAAYGSLSGELRGDLLLLAVLFGLAWEQVTGVSVIALRRVNGRFASLGRDAGVTPGLVSRRHLAAMGLDLVRAVAVVLAGWAIGAAAMRLVLPRLDIADATAAGALAVASAALVAASLSLFGSLRERLRPLLVGLVVGFLLLLVR